MDRSMLRGLVLTLSSLALGCTPGGGDGDGGTTTGPDDTTAGPTSTGPTTTTDTTNSGPTGDTTGAGPTGDSTDSGAACGLPPVDEEIVGFLFVYGDSMGLVTAGDTQLSLAWIDSGYPTVVEACIEWSIEPVDWVSIDADGLLSVDAAVPAGTVVSVTADLEDGRRLVTEDLEVYVPLQYPILGYWSEVEQLPCDGGPAFMPEPIIPELIFYDTGQFTVTWTPFEVYIDYWGSFVYDEGSGALTLTVEGGNYVPADIDGEGTATVMGDQLWLEDLWLGSAQDPVTPPACGHVFQ